MNVRQLVVIALSSTACGPDLEMTRNALMAADRDFARESQVRRLDAWVEAVGDSGVVLRAGSPVGRGADAARERLAAIFADTGSTLNWEPVFSDAARSGDLGYTVGLSQGTRRGANGEPVMTSGKYVTIWKKRPDGTWRVALQASVLD